MTAFPVHELKNELTDRIIPYWSALADYENGGFTGSVTDDLVRHPESPKGCILHSRILWFFSNAYMLLGDENLLSLAEHTYRFIMEKCIDSDNGGIFWSVTAKGKPCDTTKHTYNQAFAVYALSSYSIAAKDQKALDKAVELFELIESRCRDDGGYLEAFDVQWAPASNEKLSENGVMAHRTMNTLLHIIEGYTELVRAGGGEKVKEALRRALDTVSEKVYSEEKERLEVFFDAQMNSIIDLHSYGHDIEAAWLIDRACEVLTDGVMTAKMRVITKKLEDKIIKTAFTQKGLLNECCRGEVNRLRIWWVQAEAVTGFINAWQKRNDRTDFLNAANSIWQYIKDSVIDKRPGSEWLWEIDENGERNKERALTDEWKCPYHNGRMCIEIIRRLG